MIETIEQLQEEWPRESDKNDDLPIQKFMFEDVGLYTKLLIIIDFCNIAPRGCPLCEAAPLA